MYTLRLDRPKPERKAVVGRDYGDEAWPSERLCLAKRSGTGFRLPLELGGREEGGKAKTKGGLECFVT